MLENLFFLRQGDPIKNTAEVNSIITDLLCCFNRLWCASSLVSTKSLGYSIQLKFTRKSGLNSPLAHTGFSPPMTLQWSSYPSYPKRSIKMTLTSSLLTWLNRTANTLLRRWCCKQSSGGFINLHGDQSPSNLSRKITNFWPCKGFVL